MAAVVKARIVKVGNSQGIRIPKVVLDQLGFGPEVELAVQSDQLIIRSAHHLREDWDARFRLMAGHQDDRLLIDLANQ